MSGRRSWTDLVMLWLCITSHDLLDYVYDPFLARPDQDPAIVGVSLMRFAILILTAFSFVGCKTVDVWDQGYPHSADELKSEPQRRDEFNKFAIADGNGVHAGDGVIRTQKDKTADNDKYYSLGSF